MFTLQKTEKSQFIWNNEALHEFFNYSKLFQVSVIQNNPTFTVKISNRSQAFFEYPVRFGSVRFGSPRIRFTELQANSNRI